MIVIFALSMAFAFAQYKTTVAFVPFDYKGISEDNAETLTELFTTEYAAVAKSIVVDRKNFDKISKQHDFQNSDWSNTEKVAELGKALNADKVACGQIRTMGNNDTFSVRAIRAF